MVADNTSETPADKTADETKVDAAAETTSETSAEATSEAKPEAAPEPASEPKAETKSDSVSDLADLKSIAGDAPEGDSAEIARTASVPLREQELDAQGRAYATGRRKDAKARVWIKPGSGKVTVNGRDQEIYFARPTLRLIINQPFAITDREGQYDVCLLYTSPSPRDS